MKSLDERKAIIDAEINRRLRQGWIIASRTDTTCQITKDEKPDGCLTVLLFLTFIIPGILYLILRKKRVTLYFEVDTEGKFHYDSPDFNSRRLKEAEEYANRQL
jgi:hypothetical protein